MRARLARVLLVVAVVASAAGFAVSCTEPNPDYIPPWAWSLVHFDDGGNVVVPDLTPPPDLDEPDLLPPPDLRPPPGCGHDGEMCCPPDQYHQSDWCDCGTNCRCWRLNGGAGPFLCFVAH
jgi:hypothetical protein